MKNSHKSLAITLLLTGTLILSIINLSFYKLKVNVAELSIDVEVVEAEIEKEALSEIDENSKQTNKGFNETKKYKHFAQAYKPIAPPKDYDYTKYNTRNDNKPSEEEKVEENTTSSSIEKDELTSFESVNNILNKRSNAVTSKTQASANMNSTITYSLIGRTDEHLPIPVYLCEANGKIIVNITVNASGKVTEAYVNNASTSANQCLRDHAVEYAKKARFDGSDKASQIGSITFNFKGK